MSDDSEIERVLGSVQNALDILKNIGDVDKLLSEVDTITQRKLLKKVKNISSEMLNRANNIKDTFTKAYKASKSKKDSECDKVCENLNKNIKEETSECKNESNVDDETKEQSSERGDCVNNNINLTENTSSNLDQIKEQTAVPKIKVVDIKKLLPESNVSDTPPPIKGRKSVTFDRSVIVLSSSDEDTPKKSPRDKDGVPLKSVLRKTSPKVIDLSDSDAKENNENLRNTQSKVDSDKVTSSEESDSDIKSRSVRNKRHVKNRFSKLIQERNTRRNALVTMKKKYKGEHKHRKTDMQEHSDSSSDSEIEKQKNEELSTKNPNLNDCTSKLYVRLQKLDLQAIHKSTPPETIDSKNSSSDSQNKGIKLVLKINRIKDDLCKLSEGDDSPDSNKENSNKEHPDIVDGNDEILKDQSKESKSHSSTSDSEEDFANFSKKKDKQFKERKETKKRMRKMMSDSESESDNSEKDDDDKEEPKENDEEEEDNEEKKKNSKNPPRKRIKRVKESSSDEDDKSTRKHIRRLIGHDSLSETTLQAEQDEKERKARISEKQKKYNQIFDLKADATVEKVVLDFDESTNTPLLSVDKTLAIQLKPHQVQGVKFMWDATFESLERAKNTTGSGCILAHCMGLGKTLQVIALIHTLLTNQEKTKVEKVMVVCPVNTVLNWKNEFRKWMPNNDDFEVYELVTCKTSSINHERNYVIKNWYESGGVLIIGYNMFRTLSLVDPGPDLVICDEGHLLKNEKTNLSIAMNRIKTLRRIVLTGTPLQNNLREYWCMVQFIKPNLLGTYKEYLNRFVNPITNGQYTDSTQHDIMVMRRRSHVLHKLLDGVVQRQDYAVLEPYLPPKHEYVLFLKLTEVQVKLYKHYMENFARRSDGSNRTSFLFTDFQELQRICTHPRVLLDKSLENKERKEKNDDSESEGSLKDFIDDGSDVSTGSSSSSSDEENSDNLDSDQSEKPKKSRHKSSSKKMRLTRAQAAQKRENGELLEENEPEIVEPKHWWDDYINRDQLDNLTFGSKMTLLFQILKECEEIGDKILVFSQSLYTLNCIEYFLARIDEATQKSDTADGYTGSWALGLDYFRLDGSSSCDNRAAWCDEFNNPENTRARLFLISTKAGGLGINLVAANRVIIFDVSWNPSHDIQSIYRVYRFGQNKPSYIYRFVTYGTMEMKIYERQVTKQAISKRVIDEQQIDRHYSQNDIQELYKTDLEPEERPIPLVPKDILLGEMLQKYEENIYKYHEHQSLLENKQDEELNEDERKAAWEEFENEKVMRKTTAVTNFGPVHLGAINNAALTFSPQMIQIALGNIVRKDNPTWSEVQIRGILPALVTQLQIQMSENDFSMYNRVQQEIRLMQAQHAQLVRENFLKQFQNQQMIQKQQQLANQRLQFTPEQIRALQLAQATQNFLGPSHSNEVIDLND
ncbi:hypothetical protein ABEB36_015357 [Hypothenemus hampei]|uniref:Transcriptional regulator ATRX homolog n=1 Tax=Hypothenemus hampei TaxID=57062 RepID=A0ABD1DZY9_HYPHA